MIFRELSISKLDKNNIGEILNLQKLSYVQQYQENPNVFCQIIDKYPDGAWGVFYHNKLIGSVFFFPYSSNNVKPIDSDLIISGDEDCLYLHDLNISPQYRKQGISTLLLHMFDKITQTEGMNIQCLVAVQNSKSYWEKNGFAVFDSISHSGYTDVFFMKRYV